MTDRPTALSLLRTALDDPIASFRDGQWEAINSLVNHQERLLVVQRTGWGKSSVYFIATRILRDSGRGPTLIVSPLLALMRNQVDAARRIGIHALTINSTNTDEWPALQRAVLSDEADVLLISPERLANDEFVENVLLPIAGTIGLLVVDEAHCISDWGHDFRPDYRRLVNVLQRMPDRALARASLGGGFPVLPFRLQGGGTVPPWTTFPAALPKIPYVGFSPVRLQASGTSQFGTEPSAGSSRSRPIPPYPRTDAAFAPPFDNASRRLMFHLCVRNRRLQHRHLSPEALAPAGLCCPGHHRLSASSASLDISASFPGTTGYRRGL